MCEGVLHIRGVQGPKKTGTVKARLEAVEQEIFRFQGMVERGLSANHSMITEFIRDPKVDGRSLKGTIFTHNKQINFRQGQIFDFQNQIFEYEAKFKGMSSAASCRTLETRASSYDVEPVPRKSEDKFASTSSSTPP
ncbi:hypothetical protein ZWY2020_004616 [Hordeum vulgare]|nr:hypothetical protein ZWY2020_004616 [Hordeum vulgare]